MTFWFADPFGWAAGLGTLSAFTIENNPQPFPWTDAGFSVPEIDFTAQADASGFSLGDVFTRE